MVFEKVLDTPHLHKSQGHDVVCLMSEFVRSFVTGLTF